MNVYYPDKWVVVAIGEKPIYKVVGCWYGNYLDGASWRMNSGIVSAVMEDDDECSREAPSYRFKGVSGSLYRCSPKDYGLTGYGGSVLGSIIEKAKEKGTSIKVLDQHIKFEDLNYGGSTLS